MIALDRFLQLQKQGLSEQRIITILQQEGSSMKEINDAINQADIKSAVSQESGQANLQHQENQSPQTYQQNYIPQNNISGDHALPNYPSLQGQDYSVPQNQQYQDYSGQQSYEGYYQNIGGTGTETITDIAEQVVIKKTNEIEKKIEGVIYAKNLLDREVRDLKENLKRIESNLDNIQRAIIGKIGEFGESTKMIQRDLENIHGTMSKMMDPLIDNYNELRKLNSKET